jgi:MarR family transcriptional regulator, organic hydroperoxide resistance regulator
MPLNDHAPVSTASDSLLNLDRQLCFALYAAIRSITRVYRERLDVLGLTYPQYLVLLTLFEKDGLTVSEIGRRLYLDSGTLTPLLKRLEANGVVRRARGRDDQRDVHVWLNPEAWAMKPDILAARRYVAERLAMSEDEIAALRADLMVMIHHLEGEPVGPSQRARG